LGFVARDHGIQVAWMASALLVLAAAPAYLLLERSAPVVADASPGPASAEPTIPAKVSPPAVGLRRWLHRATGCTKMGPWCSTRVHLRPSTIGSLRPPYRAFG